MTQDIIIVGAGLAGLSCGLRLQEAGREPLILEAADAVGGRIRTDLVDGFRLDRGFQVFLTSYAEAQARLDYPALQLKAFEPGALVRFQNCFHRLSDPWRRPWKGIRSAFSLIGTLRDKLRIAALRRESIRGSVDDIFQSPDASTLSDLQSFDFSNSIIERFFRPFLGGVFLERELATSSRMFRFVFRMFSLGKATLPSAGMQAIPEQLAKKISPARIRLHSRVLRVQPDRVQLESGEVLKAKAVVIATEAPMAARLLEQPAPAAWQSVSCLYFACDEPPEREPILTLNGDGSGPVNNLCVPSVVAPSYAPPGQHLVSVTVLGTPQNPESEVRAQLEAWYGPTVKAWRHLRTYTIRYALPRQVPPALEPPRRPARTDRGIYCCGDHQENASINGAMLSGRRAAEAMLEDRQ